MNKKTSSGSQGGNPPKRGAGGGVRVWRGGGRGGGGHTGGTAPIPPVDGSRARFELPLGASITLPGGIKFAAPARSYISSRGATGNIMHPDSSLQLLDIPGFGLPAGRFVLPGSGAHLFVSSQIWANGMPILPNSAHALPPGTIVTSSQPARAPAAVTTRDKTVSKPTFLPGDLILPDGTFSALPRAIVITAAIILPGNGITLPEDSFLPTGEPSPGGITLPVGITIPVEAGVTLPGGITIPGGITLPDGQALACGCVLPDGCILPDGRVIPEGLLPGKITLPTGTKIAAEATLPGGTNLSAGMVLPCGTTLPRDTNLPGGIILPRGTNLPAGMILPAGTILPESVPVS